MSSDISSLSVLRLELSVIEDELNVHEVDNNPGGFQLLLSARPTSSFKKFHQ